MLVGYMLVHITVKAGPKIQPLIHSLIVFPVLLLLPIGLPILEKTPENPFSKLLVILAFSIGLPFLILSTTGPLLQKWYSWTDGVSNSDPYFLYGASNAGSLVGLLSYPFLIEPFVAISTQKTIWSIGFTIFLTLILGLGIVVIVQNKSSTKEKTREVKEAISDAIEGLKVIPPTLSVQLWWIVLAFIPASLQLGVTTYITTDIASIPLLWIIPLVIYLSTMTIAFLRKSDGKYDTAISASMLLTIISLTLVFIQNLSISFLIPIIVLLLVTLAVVSYTSHGLLASLRPGTDFLTKYFVYISLGGVLAGAFNGLVAPMLFKSSLEFPIVLAMVFLFILFSSESATSSDKKYRMKLLAGVMVVIIFTPAVFLSSRLQISESYSLVDNGRNFYGNWSIYESSKSKVFIHEHTFQGAQNLNNLEEPTGYYSKYSLIQEVFALLHEGGSEKVNVTVIGLGVGGLSAYADEHTSMNFIEIDPKIIQIAEDPTLFTFLSDAKKRGADITTILGDGRLEISKLPPHSQDLIVLDAFSSISIPIHILTEEAFDTYKNLLTDDGMLLVNISNNIFDFTPVLANNAKNIGMVALSEASEIPNYEKDTLYTPSDWVLIGKESSVKELEKEGWSRLPSDTSLISWTDKYSSLLRVFDWEKSLPFK